VTRDELLSDLALGLPLLDMDEQDRAEGTARACAAHPDLADLLRSLTFADVLRVALFYARVTAGRAELFLPPADLVEARREKVLSGLEARDEVDRLSEAAAEAIARALRPLQEEPPGGRQAWTGYWHSDRKHDGRRGRG
jgi:hypothetical protein